MSRYYGAFAPTTLPYFIPLELLSLTPQQNTYPEGYQFPTQVRQPAEPYSLLHHTPEPGPSYLLTYDWQLNPKSIERGEGILTIQVSQRIEVSPIN